MNKETVYISGRITSDPDYKKHFAEAAQRLEALGYFTINPAENHWQSYKEYIDIGLFQLMHCDAIYMLDGWQKSVGARLEKQYADAVGLMILNDYMDKEEQDGT